LVTGLQIVNFTTFEIATNLLFGVQLKPGFALVTGLQIVNFTSLESN